MPKLILLCLNKPKVNGKLSLLIELKFLEKCVALKGDYVGKKKLGILKRKKFTFILHFDANFIILSGLEFVFNWTEGLIYQSAIIIYFNISFIILSGLQFILQNWRLYLSIKFHTLFQYQSDNSLWSKTCFIELETLLINQPSCFISILGSLLYLI